MGCDLFAGFPILCVLLGCYGCTCAYVVYLLFVDVISMGCLVMMVVLSGVCIILRVGMI